MRSTVSKTLSNLTKIQTINEHIVYFQSTDSYKLLPKNVNIPHTYNVFYEQKKLISISVATTNIQPDIHLNYWTYTGIRAKLNLPPERQYEIEQYVKDEVFYDRFPKWVAATSILMLTLVLINL